MAEAAPATSATSTPPAAQTNGAASPEPAKTWYGEIANPDVKSFVESKKFADPSTAMEAFYHTSKMIGVPADQLIRKPKDAADTAGIAAYRQALGVPEAADKYEIPVPEGQSTALREWAAPVFYEAGLSGDQAKMVATKWNEFMASEVAKGEAADKQATAAAETTLKSEWGQQFEANRELARRAFTDFAKRAGLTDAATRMDEVMGIAGSMKLWNAIGKAMGEGTFKSGDTNSMTMTPADANAKLSALRADRDWTAKYNSGDLGKQLEMQQLQAIISGDDSGLRLIQQKMGIRS